MLRRDGIASERGERWREIKGWEGFYAVSCRGRVVSLPRELIYERMQYGRRVIVTKPTRASLMQPFRKEGYPVIWLHRYGDKTYFDVARGVLEHFGAALPSGRRTVVRKDGDLFNCRIENLKWGRHLDSKSAEERRKDLARKVGLELAPTGKLSDVQRILGCGTRLAFAVASTLRDISGWPLGRRPNRIGQVAEHYRATLADQSRAV